MQYKTDEVLYIYIYYIQKFINSNAVYIIYIHHYSVVKSMIDTLNSLPSIIDSTIKYYTIVHEFSNLYINCVAYLRYNSNLMIC